MWCYPNPHICQITHLEPNPLLLLPAESFCAKFELEEIPYKYSISKDTLQEACQNILTYSGLVSSLGQGKWHLLFNFTDKIDDRLEKSHINLTIPSTHSVSLCRWVAGWRKACWFCHEFEIIHTEEWVRNNPHTKASKRDMTNVASANIGQKGKCKTHAYPFFEVNHLVSVSVTKISTQTFLKWDSFTTKHSRQVPILAKPFMNH